MTVYDHRRPRAVLTFLSIAVCLAWFAACGAEPPAPPRTDAQPSNGGDVAQIDLATAQRVVTDYFLALEEERPADARELLAPGPRSDASEDELRAAARAVRRLDVQALEVLAAENERIVFRAEFEVEPSEEAAGRWYPGENTRWIELIRSRRGWRIQQIASEPIAHAPWSPVSVWTHTHILEAEISFEVPNAWDRQDGWSWSPPGLALPEIGVVYRDLEAGVELRTMLPAGASVVTAVPLDLEWGSGTLYTVEVPASAASPPGMRVEQHAVISAGEGRAFDFFARAPSREETRPLYWILRRMYTSAEPIPGSLLAARASRPECRVVVRVGRDSREGTAIARALVTQLPRMRAEAGEGQPAELERIGPITREADWVLVDASFHRGQGAGIYVLRGDAGTYRVEGIAWDGSRPASAEEIRAAMAENVVGIPASLVRCVDLSHWRR